VVGDDPRELLHRLAIEPGKRWMAGVVAAIAANSCGSAAAIAAGSKRAEAISDLRRTAEGVLHRILLVEHHSRQQGERGLSRIVSAAASPVIWMATGPSCPPGQSALTARTGQWASSRIRWALEPRISLPTVIDDVDR
jgi:hypothetical protein